MTCVTGEANLCEPPLNDSELAKIWNSACRFASEVAADPGYLPPEVYEALAGLRPDDFSDVGQADTLAGEYANKIRYSLATKWLVYDHGVWDKNDLSVQGVVQELTSRQLEEADRLIATSRETMTATGADIFMAAASSKARGIAKLTRVQAAAFRARDYQIPRQPQGRDCSAPGLPGYGARRGELRVNRGPSARRTR
ncbi:hypothetical protein [Gulosibacter bifidus]|uniref:Uncharacterized protein n=1 Tax=Gulosibacter bifidus TaxID=272239 RepID=A0ABW5RJW8_9MICO|nr:hypothetical protein [Gulosibacter bifidus]